MRVCIGVCDDGQIERKRQEIDKMWREPGWILDRQRSGTGCSYAGPRPTDVLCRVVRP